MAELPDSADTGVDVSIVIVSWNTGRYLSDALAALPRACAPLRWETIVVDNASEDGSPDVVRRTPSVRLTEMDSNTGFTRAANLGAAEARGRYVLFLNPDVTVPPSSISRLAEKLEQDAGAWAATPWFRNPDGTAQRFWRRLPTTMSAALCFTFRGRRLDRMIGNPVRRRHRYEDLVDPPDDGTIEGVGAACLLVRRSDFFAEGAFDERYFNFFQDTDLQRRMHRKGRRLLGIGSVEVVHQLGVTFRELSPTDLHSQLLFGLRQYLKGEPWFRRMAGGLSVRLDVVARPNAAELRQRSLKPV